MQATKPGLVTISQAQIKTVLSLRQTNQMLRTLGCQGATRGEQRVTAATKKLGAYRVHFLICLWIKITQINNVVLQLLTNVLWIKLVR